MIMKQGVIFIHLLVIQGVFGTTWERYEGKRCSQDQGSALELTGSQDGKYSLNKCKQQCIDTPGCAGTMRLSKMEKRKHQCYLIGPARMDACLEQPDGVPCSDDGARCCSGMCTEGSKLGEKGCTMRYESVKGPGAAWTEEDISITRERVFAMISPVEEDKI